MKILFLDIDGVLNSDEYFRENHDDVKRLYKDSLYNKDDIDFLLKRQMLDIDINKLLMLKNALNGTDVKVVIISSWKKLKIFPYVVRELIKRGLPIIDFTIDNGSDRGAGIKKYLIDYQVDDYVIIDDDIFDDYDQEILSKLIKTSFYNGGLKKEHVNELIKRLKK